MKKIFIISILLALSACKKDNGQHIKQDNTHNASSINVENLPSAINLPLPLKKDAINKLNSAWIQTMTNDYKNNYITPAHQEYPPCKTIGRPKGDRIWVPEQCYMVEFDMRTNKNKIIAHDILLIGNDDIISLIPQYKDGNKIITRLKISGHNSFNDIPFAGIDESAFNILYKMTTEVSKIYK